jgi:hypothetical protein
MTREEDRPVLRVDGGCRCSTERLASGVSRCERSGLLPRRVCGVVAVAARLVGPSSGVSVVRPNVGLRAESRLSLNFAFDIT